MGSNIANVGLILGLAALVKPARVDGALRRRELPVLVASTALLAGTVSVPIGAVWFDLAALGVMKLLAAAFIRTERTISRVEGAVVPTLYAVFTAGVGVTG